MIKNTWLTINGVSRMVAFDPENNLADTLRKMGILGVKVGCGKGVCGTCSVILNGELIRACTKKMKAVPDNSTIVTVEGIGNAQNPHPLQLAFVKYNSIQCGFCIPGFVVSAKALLDVNPAPTREEVRAWFLKNHNACRCTGYKTIVDGVMAAAEVLRGEKPIESLLPDEEADNVYGSYIARPNALAKALGQMNYSDDIIQMMPAGTVHLAPVFAGVSHGNILSIDDSEALKMPGVMKVLTAKDVKGTNRIVMAVGRKRSLAVGNELPIIADKVLRYGDVVALVAANSREEARAAAQKVVVNVEKLPEYMNVLDAVADDAMQIHEGIPNIYIEQPHFWGEDTEEVFDKADCVVESSYYTQREPHLALEPESAFAYRDEDGKLAIHYKTQTLYVTRKAIAGGLGIPMEEIRIVANPAGASFGYSMSPPMPALVGAASLAMDAPCALTMSWEEHQHFTGKRAPSYSNMRLAASKDGKLQAMEYEIAFDTGPYTQYAGALSDKACVFMGNPYKIPSVKGLTKIVFTNHNYSTTYRSYGVISVNFATEMILEEMASKLGIDPFEFRMKNLLREGDIFSDGHPADAYSTPEMFENLRPKYEKVKAWCKENSTDEVKYGVGIVSSVYKAGGGTNDSSEIHLELNADGTVTQFNSWEDLGQGADVGTLVHTLEALRPLGLRPDQVKLVQNDTKFVPNSGSASGSRSHYMNGLATIDAANKLLDAMRKEDGTFRTYDEMVAEGIPTKYSGKYSTTGVEGVTGINGNTGLGRNMVQTAYAVMMATVEVNVKTGKIRVIDFDCESDNGRVGSLQAVEGQCFGGIEHGIGTAISENYDDIKKDANIVGAGFPFIDAIPDSLTLNCRNQPRGNGPHGSTGCSEAFQSGSASVVICAVHDACGIWMRQLPAKPDRVLKALDDKAKGIENPPTSWYLGADFNERLDWLKNNPV